MSSSVIITAYKSNNVPDMHILHYGALTKKDNYLYFEIINPYHDVSTNTTLKGFEIKEYTLSIGSNVFKTNSAVLTAVINTPGIYPVTLQTEYNNGVIHTQDINQNIRIYDDWPIYDYNKTRILSDLNITLPYTLEQVLIKPNEFGVADVLNNSIKNINSCITALKNYSTVIYNNTPTQYIGWLGQHKKYPTEGIRWHTVSNRPDRSREYASVTTDPENSAFLFNDIRDIKIVAGELYIVNKLPNGEFSIIYGALLTRTFTPLVFKSETQFLTQVKNIAAIEIVPIDNYLRALYILDNLSNKIFKVTLNISLNTFSSELSIGGYGVLSQTIGGYGGKDEAAKFYSPSSFHFKGEDLYVVDNNNFCVKQFSSNLGWKKTFFIEEFRTDNPIGILVNTAKQQGTYYHPSFLYVLTNTGKIYLLKQDGSIYNTIILQHTETPIKFILDYAEEYFYVIYSKFVVKYSILGLYINIVNIVPGDLSFISGCSDSYHNIYIADSRRLFKFLDVTEDFSIIRPEYNSLYWAESDLIVKEDEFFQDWVINRSLKRLAYNVEIFQKSIHSRFGITSTYSLADILTYFTAIPITNANSLFCENLIERVGVGANELVLAQVVNRSLEKIYACINDLKSYVRATYLTAEEGGNNCSDTFCWSWKSTSCFNVKLPILRVCNINPITFTELTDGFTGTYAPSNKWYDAYGDCCEGIRPTRTATPTQTITPTNTPTPTQTPSFTPSFTPTNTSTLTNTPTNTPSFTQTPTNTPTINPTPTQTPTFTPTPVFVDISCDSTVREFGPGFYMYRLNTTFTSNISVIYDTFHVPDRFTLLQGGVAISTTGFVGDTSYDPALAAIGMPAVAGPGRGVLVYTPNAAVNNLLVVEAPLPDTEFGFTIKCPPTTQTQTPTVTPTPTQTPSVTPTLTQTPTQSPTQTPTNTETPTQTPTNTPTPTESPTNTPTPTITPTTTETPTQTPTVTMTMTPTVTQWCLTAPVVSEKVLFLSPDTVYSFNIITKATTSNSTTGRTGVVFITDTGDIDLNIDPRTGSTWPVKILPSTVTMSPNLTAIAVSDDTISFQTSAIDPNVGARISYIVTNTCGLTAQCNLEPWCDFTKETTPDIVVNLLENTQYTFDVQNLTFTAAGRPGSGIIRPAQPTDAVFSGSGINETDFNSSGNPPSIPGNPAVRPRSVVIVPGSVVVSSTLTFVSSTDNTITVTVNPVTGGVVVNPVVFIRYQIVNECGIQSTGFIRGIAKNAGAGNTNNIFLGATFCEDVPTVWTPNTMIDANGDLPVLVEGWFMLAFNAFSQEDSYLIQMQGTEIDPTTGGPIVSNIIWASSTLDGAGRAQKLGPYGDSGPRDGNGFILFWKPLGYDIRIWTNCPTTGSIDAFGVAAVTDATGALFNDINVMPTDAEARAFANRQQAVAPDTASCAAWGGSPPIWSGVVNNYTGDLDMDTPPRSRRTGIPQAQWTQPPFP